jgi:hypothetical protein
MCIAHQLKQADYNKMTGLMKDDVFKICNKIFVLVVAKKMEIKNFINMSTLDVGTIYNGFFQKIKNNGDKFINELEAELKSGWGWYSYMPPEARGAVLAGIVEAMQVPQYASNIDLKQSAAFCINELVATTQSDSHLSNTFDRVTFSIGSIADQNSSVIAMSAIVAGTQFATCIECAEAQLEHASALSGRPFLRNDEAEFALAQFPLSHTAYNIV